MVMQRAPCSTARRRLPVHQARAITLTTPRCGCQEYQNRSSHPQPTRSPPPASLKNDDFLPAYHVASPALAMIAALFPDTQRLVDSFLPGRFIGAWPAGQDGRTEATAYHLKLQNADGNVALRPILDESNLEIDSDLLNMQYAITPPLPAGLQFTVTPDGTEGSVAGKISGDPNDVTSQTTSLHTITATAGANIYQGRQKTVYLNITIDP